MMSLGRSIFGILLCFNFCSSSVLPEPSDDVDLFPSESPFSMEPFSSLLKKLEAEILDAEFESEEKRDDFAQPAKKFVYTLF